MRIGVISDTHDCLESIQKAVEVFKKNNVGLIIHCGDWISPFVVNYFGGIPVKGILGNNKGDVEIMKLLNQQLPEPLEIEFEKEFKKFELEDKKYCIIHGDDKKLLEREISREKFQAIFTGHNHQVRNELNGKTLVLNPGSASFIVSGKIVKKASFAIYDSEKNSAEIIDFSKKYVYCQNH